MRDNALITLINKNIKIGMKARGFENIHTWQLNQPAQQGLSSDPVLYLHKVIDNRVGSPGHLEQYDEINSVMKRVTTEIILSTYQITGTIYYDAEDPNAITAADIVKAAASVMQTPEFQKALIDAGVNILRIGDVNTIEVSNDETGWEKRPVFDFLVNHKDITIIEIPTLEKISCRIHRV